jgi:hypothetical protein
MLMQKPVIATLRNSKTGRWHPILFREEPLPGPAPEVVRHKSRGHHTEGFESQEAADDHSRNELAPRVEGARLALDTVIEWDGEGIPAVVHFFG